MLAKSQYYIGTLDQEDAVVYIKGGNYNLKGNSLEIKNAATYLTDSNVSFIRGNTLTNEATLRKIKSGYPVVALMFYDDGDGNEANDEGHSIIIFKGNDSYNFAFYDPSPNKTDEYWYSYSDFVNGISGGPFSVTYEWRYYVSVSGFASGV